MGTTWRTVAVLAGWITACGESHPAADDVPAPLDAPPIGCRSDDECAAPLVCVLTTGTCEPPVCGCVSDADCDDGVFCNGEETCSSSCAETCSPGTPVACDVGERCDEDADDCVADAPGCDAPALWFADADGDGYGATGDAVRACTAPSGRVAAGGDCNDTEPAQSPSAGEVCGTPLDEDCDGGVDEGCAGSCTAGMRRPCGVLPGCPGIQMCSVTARAWASCDAPVAAAERCNGEDDDCDGEIDEAAPEVMCGEGVACASGACASRAIRSIGASNGLGFVAYDDGASRAWGGAMPFPANLPHLSGVRDVRGGETGAVCALLADGRVACGEDATAYTHMRIVPEIRGAISLGVGMTSGCYVRSDGQVLCWGQASRGQLGPEVTMDQTMPVEVAGASEVVEVANAFQGSCALRRDGTVLCWGDATFGVLGDGTDTGFRAEPMPVIGIDDATDLSGSGSHFCVARPSGIWCWGNNDGGGLGDGTTTDRSAPVLSDGWPAGVRLPDTLAGGATCVVTAERTVLCRGEGTVGQLGDGRGVSSTTPVAVTGLTDVRQLVAGPNRWCALTGDQEVWCWGLGPMNALGDGLSAMAYAPVRVGMLP